VREYGTGAINIDATRVRTDENLSGGAYTEGGRSSDLPGADRSEAAAGMFAEGGGRLPGEYQQPSGRWPSNLVLAHAPGCKRVGSKKVEASRAGTLTSTEKALGLINDDGWQPKPTKYQYPEDGQETVEDWECVEGCPVRELDEQSGDRPSTLTGRADPNTSQPHPGTEMNPNSTFLGERTHHSDVYADSGGASRFFPQFEGDEPGEWECVEGCPVKELDEQSGELHSGKPAKDGYFGQRHSDKGYSGNIAVGSEMTGYGDDGGASRFFPSFPGQEPVGVPFRYVAKPGKKETQLDGEIKNDHPTKKPVELMRWLVRLACPKGGIVLDPYCGSGTTLHAACEEEMLYVGIDNDPHAVEIAKARMDIVTGREQERRAEMGAFDFAMGLDDDD